jgi:hypothetical protein
MQPAAILSNIFYIIKAARTSEKIVARGWQTQAIGSPQWTALSHWRDRWTVTNTDRWGPYPPQVADWWACFLVSAPARMSRPASKPPGHSLRLILSLSLSFLVSLRSASAQGLPLTDARCGWAHLSSRMPTLDLASTDAYLHLARSHAAAMENLISLVNKLQWACVALGDHGEESALCRTTSQLPPMVLPCL